MQAANSDDSIVTFLERLLTAIVLEPREGKKATDPCFSSRSTDVVTIDLFSGCRTNDVVTRSMFFIFFPKLSWFYVLQGVNVLGCAAF